MGIWDAMAETANLDFLTGVLLMLGGTILQNVGLGMMKLIHMAEERKPNPRDQVVYWKNPRWWGTFAMFLVGAVMDFGSLGLLPASLALPLGGVGLAASSFFATRFVGESFTRRDKIGTTLIIVGSWSAVLFATKVDRMYTAADLLARFSPLTGSGLYVVLVGFWFVGLYVMGRMGYQNAVFAAALPGSVGAFGNIGGKGTSELIRASAEVGNQFVYPFSWGFVVFTAATLIIQNHFLQAALARFDQVIVVPIYYVSICMFSVLGGVLFFGEWDESSQMSVPQAMLFLCGVAVIFYGVYLLTKDHLKPDSFKARDVLPTSHATPEAALPAVPLNELGHETPLVMSIVEKEGEHVHKRHELKTQ